MLCAGGFCGNQREIDGSGFAGCEPEHVGRMCFVTRFDRLQSVCACVNFRKAVDARLVGRHGERLSAFRSQRNGRVCDRMMLRIADCTVQNR
jgi:hypothetical protein